MSLETLSHAPSSRDLLDQLTRTVKDRWAEFNAVLNAPDFLKNTKPEYVEMKQNYTLITTELSKLSSDTELRSSQVIRSHMEDFLSKVSAYMASPDAEAKYRPTLERAQSEIANLKRQIYLEQAQQSRDQSKEQVSAQTTSRLEQVTVPTTAAGAVALERSRATTPSTPVAPVSTTSQSPSRPGDESAQKENTWLDKISHFGDVWDLATKVKEKAGFLAAASFFFATIFAKDKIVEMASKYGIEVPSGSKNTPKAPSQETREESNSSITPLLTANLVLMRSIHKNQIGNFSDTARTSGEAILTHDQFLRLPFQSYRTLVLRDAKPDGTLKANSELHRKIDNDLLPALGLTPNKQSYESIMYALGVMYEYPSVTPDPKKENLSQMIYQKIPQTATISQVLTGSVVSDMSYMQQIQQLDITDVSSISTKLSPGVMITSNGEIAGNQADQVHSLFNPSTLKAIASKSNAPFPIESFTSEHLMKDSQLSGASLEELNRLSKFRSNLSQSLLGAQWVYDLEKSSLLNKFGRSVSLASVIEKELRNMTYMQVLQYYTILGGKGLTNDQSGIQKFLTHGIFTSLVEGSKDNDAQGKMMAINAILVRQNIASSDVVIPEDIKSIFANIVGTTTQKASNTIDGMLEQFWAAFKQAPAEATVITGTGVLYAIFGKWLPAKDGSVYDRYLKE